MTCRFAVLLTISQGLFAGCGVFVDFGNPVAAGAPDAVATLRLFNCLGTSRPAPDAPAYPREDFTVTGSAEGLVNGKRVSLPIRIEKLAIPGLMGVWWTQPAEGAWILKFAISNVGPYYFDGEQSSGLGILASVRGGSGIERRTQFLTPMLSEREILTVLTALAGNQDRPGRDTGRKVPAPSTDNADPS